MSEERIYSDVTDEVVEELVAEAIGDTTVGQEMVQEPVVAKKGLATTALVFGILSIVTTLFLLNYVFGLVAIIVSIIYLVKKADVKPKGKAVTGLVLALLSIIISTTIWVSLYFYLTRTSIVELIDTYASLTGQDIDGREVANDFVLEATGNVVSYDTIEEFVGGEVSVEKIKEFIGDVASEEITKFKEELDTMSAEKKNALTAEFGGEVTYESLQEKFGKDFSLEEVMDYVRDYKVQ